MPARGKRLSPGNKTSKWIIEFSLSDCSSSENINHSLWISNEFQWFCHDYHRGVLNESVSSELITFVPDDFLPITLWPIHPKQKIPVVYIQLHHPGPPLKRKSNYKIIVTVVLRLLWSLCTSCHTALEVRTAACASAVPLWWSFSLRLNQLASNICYSFYVLPGAHEATADSYSRVSRTYPDMDSKKKKKSLVECSWALSMQSRDVLVELAETF